MGKRFTAAGCTVPTGTGSIEHRQRDRGVPDLSLTPPGAIRVTRGAPRAHRFPPARRRGVCGEPQGDAGGEWESPGERGCAPASRSSPGYREPGA